MPETAGRPPLRSEAELAVILGLDLAPVYKASTSPARHDPVAAQRGKACIDVDMGLRVGIGAGGVVDPHRRLAALKIDLAHRNTDAGAGARAHVNLAAAADGAGGDADFYRGIDVGHVCSLLTADGARAHGFKRPAHSLRRC